MSRTERSIGQHPAGQVFTTADEASESCFPAMVSPSSDSRRRLAKDAEQDTSVAETIEKVIVATIIGESLLGALRQMTQEHASRPLLQHAVRSVFRRRFDQ